MQAKYLKKVNSEFFKNWNEEMAYVLGYVTADGCICVNKNRIKNNLTLDITSAEKRHLYKIRRAINSDHKIGKKNNGHGNNAFRLQIRNSILTQSLISLGIPPNKTFNLRPIHIPNEYFSDFARGFFDGDGTVYIYKVNKVKQIKVSFACASLVFIKDFNKRLCLNLNIPIKTVHIKKTKGERNFYDTYFYINDCEKLANYFYKNNPSLFMLRKKIIFEKWEKIKKKGYKKQNYPSKIGWHLNKISKII